MYIWNTVVKSLIEKCVAEGLYLHSVHDGEETLITDNIDSAVNEVCGVDESTVFFCTDKDLKVKKGIFIVLGNGPEEIVCDYNCDRRIDKAVELHYNEWEDKPVPTLGE